jgi:CCR4-NOT transcription complex subunit 4
MEPLEVDDIGFYPCTCGYQVSFLNRTTCFKTNKMQLNEKNINKKKICRFCWHRLKTDGNGLCPACRKPYSDNPAHFEPLSEEEIIRIKKERRQKEVQKKQKLTENRRHLHDTRVVQKNLVFVVGLSPRLADQEVLKRPEYFGKFGKILKVVINPSPSYAGTQVTNKK